MENSKWKQIEIVRECHDINGYKTWGVKYMCETCGFKTIAIENNFAQYNFCPSCGKKLQH